MCAFPVSLDRPLAVLDIESTGISPRADRIIELAVIRLEPDGRETPAYWLVNPTIPIPIESTAVHGIAYEHVKSCPTFAQVAPKVAAFLDNCDLAGFNAARFDIPMLSEEFMRAGVAFDADSRRVLDAQRIFHVKEPRDLSAALRFFCGIEHTDAHGAEADARATLEVLRGEFRKYPDLPQNMEALDRVFNAVDPFNADRGGRIRWVDGEMTINFGKKKGQKVRDLVRDDSGFLKWMLRGDFPLDTRRLIQNALDGVFPPPPGGAASQQTSDGN
ncbi:MAG: 3'-5' exonuclease [Kiritimatiellae bacterium]|nr:3'-5' exonuclease [Kiritimatiellia bacterium]